MLFHRARTSGDRRGGVYTAWRAFWPAVNVVSGVTATAPAPNRVDVFWAGSDRHLWHMSTSDGLATVAFDDWGNEGNDFPMQGDPAAASTGPNRLDVFVRGVASSSLADVASVNGSITWNHLPPIPTGSYAGDPAATASSSGVLVAQIGTNSRTWTWRPSSGWASSTPDTFLGPRASISFGPNR